MELKTLKLFLAKNLQEADLGIFMLRLTENIVDGVLQEVAQTANKTIDPSKLNDETMKKIIKERGYGYIADIMDTLTGVQYDTLIQFTDLISQFKGTRTGMELVLRLLGFDSIIREWWQNNITEKPAWTYDIIVVVNTSNVPDLYNTIDKLKVFSRHYVIPNISNIDVRFSAVRFAQKAVIMGGFVFQTHRGRIIGRAS